MVTLLLVLFVVGLLLGIPIAFCLGLSSVLTIFILGDLPLMIIGQMIYAAADSFSLLAIPFFMLAGNLMGSGGISNRLVDFANYFFGRTTGGMGMVAVATSMFFAAISGSGPATVAALGAIVIPAMINLKYDKGYAAALMATAGSVGTIIPPSIPMIVYGVQAELSVAKIFMAGIVPGLLFGGSLMLLNYVVSRRHGYQVFKKQLADARETLDESPAAEAPEEAYIPKTAKPKATATKKIFAVLFLLFIVVSYVIGRLSLGASIGFLVFYAAILVGLFVWDPILALIMPIIILGGIYTGLFTPTESAGIAVVYGLFVGLFAYGELKIKNLPEVIVQSAVSTAMILLIIMFASLFSFILVSEGAPQSLIGIIRDVTTSPFVTLILLNIFLLIVGCFLDSSSAIIVLSPLLLPLASAIGVDYTHFGIIMIVNLAIGLVTPPVGLDLYVACAIAKISLEQIIRAVWPFIAVTLVVQTLITYIPGISLWLPRALGY